ncbi:MAG: hypothetical protein AMJ95_03385 [Omnitrophica WOR_2 bacterium SM23_72]|nr:MAG: hypothetical protein AMJ95_03385 [Omnitrophica WOR_2 bacterium SM23_72]
MKERALKVSNFLIYWSIVIMPFTVAISPAIANTFIGFMTFFYLLKKFLNLPQRGLFKTPLDTPFLLIIIFSGLSFINSVDLSDSIHGMMKWVSRRDKRYPAGEKDHLFLSFWGDPDCA